MILSTFVLVIISLDATVFGQFRYHISPIVLKLVFGKRASDIFQFSTSNILLSIALIIGLVALQFIFYYLAKTIIRKEVNIKAKLVLTFFVMSLLSSHLIYAWSDANYYRPVTQVKNVFPLFFPLTADKLMAKLNLVDEDKVKKNQQFSMDLTSNTVHYPLKEIISEEPQEKKNILFIIVDSWRFDCMTSEITPNIYNFSKKSQVFNNHMSGSNMTTGGIFSIFYGIPATYFDTFTGQEIAPVFMNELQKQKYQLKIFASANLENPPFNRNIFAKIPNLRLFSKGEKPSDRDLQINNEWLISMEKSDAKKPFFGFLFYDSAHGFDYPTNYKTPFKPTSAEVNYLTFDDDYNPKTLINRYKNALHYIDELVGKVLLQLEQKNLLSNTIIVITGDHGQEFNDNKKGYWQHGGNFSKYQVQVPMMIFDASKSPKTYSQQTLHYDLTATLMKEYMGVKSNYENFSFGKNLFKPTSRDYFVCGYNQKYAIVEKNRITNIYPSGLFDITDSRLNLLENQEPNYNIITRGLIEMNRFYIKKKS